MKPWIFRLGAYVVFPLLAAAGGLLLARAVSAVALAGAAVLLAAALSTPVVLGWYCRHCGERVGPRLLRMLVMPAAVCAALAFRSAQSGAQFWALGLIGLAVVAFLTAFRLTRQESRPRQF